MKIATRTAVLLLSLVAVVHILRLFFDWDFVIGGWSAPMWASYLGVAIPGGLAFFIYREHR